MSYKEKHLHQLGRAFKVLALSMAMLIPAGCTDKKEKDENAQPVGLLDKTPLKTNDKYGAKVTLYLVDVPIYTNSGERKKEQYVLTRGLNNSDYVTGTKRYVRKAYFNNSPDAVFVQVDENNAVVTEKGAVGLFLGNDGKVVVVSDNNVSDFIREKDIKNAWQSSYANSAERAEKTSQTVEAEDSISNISVSDSIESDTLKVTATDTLKTAEKAVADTNVLQADTFNLMRQKIRE